MKLNATKLAMLGLIGSALAIPAASQADSLRVNLFGLHISIVQHHRDDCYDWHWRREHGYSDWRYYRDHPGYRGDRDDHRRDRDDHWRGRDDHWRGRDDDSRDRDGRDRGDRHDNGRGHAWGRRGRD